MLIIAILIAIAIPIFTSQLAKANAATDAANIRSGYAMVQSDIILGDHASGTATLLTDGTVKWTGATGVTGTEYTAKGNSGDLSESADIGGIGATWEKDDKIVYTVENGKITKIDGE